jgi:hypothetical protein
MLKYTSLYGQTTSLGAEEKGNVDLVNFHKTDIAPVDSGLCNSSSKPYHTLMLFLKVDFNITSIPFIPMSLNGVFPSRFLTTILYRDVISPHAFYMSRRSEKQIKEKSCSYA